MGCSYLVFEAASKAFVNATQQPLRGTPLVQDILVASHPACELCQKGAKILLRVLRRAHPQLSTGLVVGHDLSAHASDLSEEMCEMEV